MTIDKEARSKADDALVVANKAKKGIKDRQVKNISVASQSAMLALTGVAVGQEVIREDDNFYKYFLKALPASNLANWQVIGKDTPPIGETVEDIITNNEVITSKPDGLYAFAAIPNGGLPVGIARGDIAQKTGSSWTVSYTFANAPASIFAKSDGKVYNKKVDGSNNPTWFILPDPTFYEVGSGKEYATLQDAIDAYAVSGRPLGVINVFDQTIAENVTINANTQNLLIQGFGTVGRANTQISKITILGHRVTLNTLQINEIEINSAGTITENGVPNIGRGKHIFDKVTFANATTAITVTAINNFLGFYYCDFSSKIISIANHTGTPTSVTFNNCQNAILNLGSNRLCIKAYSLSVYRGTITGTIIDLDSAIPVAYSLLRTYTALGLPVPVALGTMIINDDIGGNLANLKCTTAYTIAATLGVGTPIDLTKYQAQTGGTGGSITITYASDSTNLPTTANTGDKVYVTSDGTSAGIIEEQWEYNGTDWILIEGVYPVSGAVVDNTIGDSALITTPGRYIVPATGLLNEFVGQANKYADYDGSIFSFIAPTNNDTVQINSGQNVGTVWKFTTAGGWAKVTSTATTVLGALKTPLFGNLIANYAEDNKGLAHALDVAIQNKVIQQLKNGTIFDLTPGGVQGQAMGISVNWFGRTIYKFADNTNAFPNANYNALIVNVPAGVRSVFLQVNNDVNGGHLCVRADYLDANNRQAEHLGYFVQQKDKQQFVRPFANNFRNNAGFHTWLMIPVHKAGKLAISLATVLSQADLWVGAIAFSDNAHNFMYEPALSYHWVVNKQNDLTTSAQFGGNNNIIWYNANPWTDGANIVRATLQFPIAQRAWARVRVVKPSDGQDIILHYTSWDKSSALPEVWRIRKRDGTYVTVASGSQASPNFDVQSSLWTHQLASVSASISTYIQSYHLKIPFAIWKDCIQVPTIDSPKLDFLNQGANLTITNAQANANQCFHISFTATGRAVTIQAPTNATRFYTVYNRGANAFTFAGINIPANSFVNLLYNSTTATWSVPTQQECFLDFEFWSYAVGDRYFLHIATSSSSIF